MMYYLHCTKCHHEWDSATEVGKCNWCGGDSYVLAVHKPFDYKSMLRELINLKNMWSKINN